MTTTVTSAAPIPPKTHPGLARGTAALFLLAGLASGLLFLYFPLATRVLSQRQYSVFASCFSVVLLVGALGAVVQTHVAAEVARVPTPERARQLLRTWARRSAVTAGCLMLASPLSRYALHTSSAIPLVFTALAAGTALWWAAWLGVVQGRGALGLLGGLQLVQAFGRCVSVVPVLVAPSADLALLCAALSYAVPLAVARHCALGRDRQQWGPRGTVPAVATQPRAALVITALVVATWSFPTVGDVLLSRTVLQPGQAALFSGAALTARIILFPSTAITAGLFPHLVSATRTDGLRLARNAALAIGALGVVCAAVLLADPQLTLRLVVGPAYIGAATTLMLSVVAALVWALGAPFAYFFLAQGQFRRCILLGLGGLTLQVVLPLLCARQSSTMSIMGLIAAGTEFVLCLVLLGSSQRTAVHR